MREENSRQGIAAESLSGAAKLYQPLLWANKRIAENVEFCSVSRTTNGVTINYERDGNLRQALLRFLNACCDAGERLRLIC